MSPLDWVPVLGGYALFAGLGICVAGLAFFAAEKLRSMTLKISQRARRS